MVMLVPRNGGYCGKKRPRKDPPQSPSLGMDPTHHRTPMYARQTTHRNRLSLGAALSWTLVAPCGRMARLRLLA